MKYIVIYTYPTKEQNPFWLAAINNIEPQYITTSRTSVYYFENQHKLAEFLAANPETCSQYRVFEVSKELQPLVQTEVKVSFK